MAFSALKINTVFYCEREKIWKKFEMIKKIVAGTCTKNP